MKIKVGQFFRFLLDKIGFPLEGQPEGQKSASPDGQAQPGEGGNFADDVNPAMGSWYAPFKPLAKAEGTGEPPAKKAKKGKNKQRPGLGYDQTAMLGSVQMQWTPEGWVPKDNSHKVTSTMKPLPKVSIVPPLSATYPQAAEDSDKLKILQNNVSMMAAELVKITKRFNIDINKLNRSDLSPYPEHQQEKLRTAITCVSNAEKTLNNFKEFLSKDKYKEWNENQKKEREDQMKAMIGDTPTGVPHKRPQNDNNEDDEASENPEETEAEANPDESTE